MASAIATAKPGVIVVTGCTAGLGFHCASSLATKYQKSSAIVKIVFACRNVSAARSAADKISKSTGYSRENIIVLDEGCDLSEMKQVRIFAAALKKWLALENETIKILINNAGVGGSPDFRKTSENHDAIFATNHLGHFLLTLLLLPYITERIVNVSSEVSANIYCVMYFHNEVHLVVGA